MNNKSVHKFIGMNQDLSPMEVKETFAYEIRNMRITVNKTNNSLMLWTNERGPKQAYHEGIPVTIKGTYLGHVVLNNYLIVFSTESSNNIKNDHIVVYTITDEIDNGIDLIAPNVDVGFNTLYPIEAISLYETEKLQKIYFVDGINQPRVVNLVAVKNFTNINNKNIEAGELAQYFYTDNTKQLLNFNTTIKLKHSIQITKKDNDNGTFPTGVIQYAFSYFNYGMQESTLFEITPLYYLSPKDKGEETTKLQNCSFSIQLTDLDIAYSYVRCYAIVRTSQNNTPVCRIVGDYPITNAVVNIKDDGSNGSSIDNNKLLYIGSKYFIASTLTHKDGTLFLGNIKYDDTKYNIKWDSFHIDPCLIDYYGNKAYDVLWSNTTAKAFSCLDNYQPHTASDYEDKEDNYEYTPDNNRSSRAVKRFKSNEYYKLGIVCQFNDGSYSNVIPVKIVQNGSEYGLKPVLMQDISDDNPIKQLSADIYKGNNIAHCTLTPSYRLLLYGKFINWCKGIYHDDNYPKLSDGKYVARVYPVVAYPTEQYRSCITQGFLSPTVFDIINRNNKSTYAQSSWVYRYYNSAGTKTTSVPSAYHFGSLYFSNCRHGEIANMGIFLHSSDNPWLRGKDGNDAREVLDVAESDIKEKIFSDVTRIVIPKNKDLAQKLGNVYFQDCEILTLNSPESELGYLDNNGFLENAHLRIVGFSSFTKRSATADNCSQRYSTTDTDNIKWNVGNQMYINNFIYTQQDVINAINRASTNETEYPDSIAFSLGYINNVGKGNVQEDAAYSIYNSSPFFRFYDQWKGFAHYLWNSNYYATVTDDGSNGNHVSVVDPYKENESEVYGSLFFDDVQLDKSVKVQVHYGFTDYNNVNTTTLNLAEKNIPKIYNLSQADTVLQIDTLYDNNVSYKGVIDETILSKKYDKDNAAIYTCIKEDGTVKAIGDMVRDSNFLFMGKYDYHNKEQSNYNFDNYLQYSFLVQLRASDRSKFAVSLNYRTTPHCVFCLGNNRNYSDATKYHTALTSNANIIMHNASNDLPQIPWLDKEDDVDTRGIDHYGVFKNSYLSNPDDRYYAGIFIGELFRDPGEVGIVQKYKVDENNKVTIGDYILKDSQGNILDSNVDSVGFPYYVGHYEGYSLGDIIDSKCTYMGGKEEEYNLKWSVCGKPAIIKQNNTDSKNTAMSSIWHANGIKTILNTAGIKKVLKEYTGIDYKETDSGFSELYEIVYTEGDCYVGRYDSMKAYSYSEDSMNTVLDIYSSELESWINLDERIDQRNKQIGTKPISSQVAGNLKPYGYNEDALFNYFDDNAYNQNDNFFVYQTYNDYMVSNTNFPNQITWSLEKTLGEDIDTWTNIQLTSLLDLDGSKGDLQYLTTFMDTIYSFQDRGLARINFNSRVQVPTSDNTPIEITNGYKVDGKTYISDCIGTNNKWSIVNGTNGIYFIDNKDNNTYVFDGKQLSPLSLSVGMQKWFNNKSLYDKWHPQYKDSSNKHNHSIVRCFYDIADKEVYYVYDDIALVYNEVSKTYTAFYDYPAINIIETIGNKNIIAFDNKLMYTHEGEYNKLISYDYYNGISFTPVNHYIDFYSHGEILSNKIWNNIEWFDDSWYGKDYIHHQTGKDDLSFNKLTVSTPISSSAISFNTTYYNKYAISGNKQQQGHATKKMNSYYMALPRYVGNSIFSKYERHTYPYIHIKLECNVFNTAIGNVYYTDIKHEFHNIVLDYFT